MNLEESLSDYLEQSDNGSYETPKRKRSITPSSISSSEDIYEVSEQDLIWGEEEDLSKIIELAPQDDDRLNFLGKAFDQLLVNLNWFSDSSVITELTIETEKTLFLLVFLHELERHFGENSPNHN